MALAMGMAMAMSGYGLRLAMRCELMDMLFGGQRIPAVYSAGENPAPSLPPFRVSFRIRFCQCIFDHFFDAFWIDFGTQNGSKMLSKSALIYHRFLDASFAYFGDLCTTFECQNHHISLGFPIKIVHRVLHAFGQPRTENDTKRVPKETQI